MPFKGDDVSSIIRARLTAATKRTYNAAQLLFVEGTTRVPGRLRKAPVPLLAKSNVIYQFDCICGSRYVGRTQRHLETRIQEHLPKLLQHFKSGCAKSTIRKHLVESHHIVNPKTAFKIIFMSTQPSIRRIVEAVAINRPETVAGLQNELVTNVFLPW